MSKREKSFVILPDQDINHVRISLTKNIENIRKTGLDDINFYNVLNILLSDIAIDKSTQSLMLDCLIPRSVLSAGSTKKIVLWFFSNAHSPEKNAKSILHWISTLLKYKLVNNAELEFFYNQYIKYIRFDDYATPLSEIIIQLTQPKNVTKSNLFLLEEAYKSLYKDRSIAKVLSTYYECCPHLVPECYKRKKEKETENLTDFAVAVLNSSRRLGIKLNTNEKAPIYSGTIPKEEYQNNDGKKIADLTSMQDLGYNLKKLILPENELSLLSSKQGIMYLIINGPSHKFLQALSSALLRPTEALLHSLIELQQGLMHGLPQITNYLSDFLIPWDGVKNLEIVCGFIPWLYFDTLNELKTDILKPLFRAIMFSSVETKAKIFNALTKFLANMVSVQVEGYETGRSGLINIKTPEWLRSSNQTLIILATDFNTYIFNAILLENQNCLALVSQAIAFNYKILTITEECHLDCFIAIPSAAVYYALFSASYAIVNELCSLITRYKKGLIPHLSTLGVLDRFTFETQLIENYANNIFTYLWRGDAGDEITCFPSETHPMIQELISKTIGKKHLGIYPLMKFLIEKAGGDFSTITKKDLLIMLENFAEDIANFIKFRIKEENEMEMLNRE